jgi:hypothetical protein
MSSAASPVVVLGFTLGFSVLALSTPARADQAMIRALAESNVNQQYLIESVSISGVEVERFHDSKLPMSLRKRLAGLVGAPCDMSAIGDLAGRLRSTLHLQDVKQHLSRGSSPDRIRVDFEVVKREYAFDLSVPRFLYHSNQGWTAAVNASARFREHTLAAALESNGDDLVERFTGFSSRYDNSRLLSDHVRFGFAVEGWHEQWNPSTRDALYLMSDNAGVTPVEVLYRTRRNIAPEVTFVLSKDLSVSMGASLERMEMEPTIAHTMPAPGRELYRNANAATADVIFGHTLEEAAGDQRWDARYGLRIGTHDLGSDYVYSRQMVSLRYERRWGRHVVSDRLIAGSIAGQAPLFERFVLGNSSTLRGWDRYAIDPLGGDRMAHNSVAYGYQLLDGAAEVFYDAGIIGSADKPGPLRHSVGFGFRQGIFNVAMAFPMIRGRIAPVLMAGMNY